MLHCYKIANKGNVTIAELARVEIESRKVSRPNGNEWTSVIEFFAGLPQVMTPNIN